MIEGCIRPRRFIVTSCTIQWETGIRVVRSSGRVVIRDVAGFAGVRRVGIVPVVALIATHRNVGSHQWPNGMIIICGTPTRVGRVACCAIGREACGLVVRVRGSVEIILMACNTFRRSISEGTRCVALVAIIDGMTQGQWEKIMINMVGVPIITHRIMALDTIRREPVHNVVWCLGCLVVVGMATDTIVPNPFELQGISIRMAFGATYISVRADQCESVLFM